jgi:hypothetical protein
MRPITACSNSSESRTTAPSGRRVFRDCKPLRFATPNEPPHCASGTRACWRFCKCWSLFCLQPEGFRHAQLRAHLASLLGLDPDALTAGQMTYQLRRLRLHGLIERIPRTHRYRLTDFGRRTALFLPRLYARTIRPALSLIDPKALPVNHRLQRAFANLDQQINLF